MRYFTVIAGLAALAASCGRSADREFPINGQILGVQADRHEVLLKHEDIKGFMPGMTMPFRVEPWSDGEARVPGDLISATLVVRPDDAYLKNVRKTGTAPLDVPPPTPTAASGFELLKPGEPIPDQTFIDERGKTRNVSDFKGRAVAITFIYTRCPMPTYCPLMDRHFATLQQKIKADPALRARVQLLSISFDPAYDTPDVLKQHAASLGADPAMWNFFTGSRDDIDRFGMRFGVQVTREGPNAGDIAHNLRTVVIDRDGKLVKVYTGVDWTPDQILSDLQSIARS